VGLEISNVDEGVQRFGSCWLLRVEGGSVGFVDALVVVEEDVLCDEEPCVGK